ncbi:hypothetical protein D9M72_372280 [compost metagenome]
MQAQRAHIKAVSLELSNFGDGGWRASIVLHYELQADTHGRSPPFYELACLGDDRLGLRYFLHADLARDECCGWVKLSHGATPGTAAATGNGAYDRRV